MIGSLPVGSGGIVRHCATWLGVMSIGGCSLVFSASDHQGGAPSRDGSVPDTGTADTGRPPDAGCTEDNGCKPVPSYVGEENWGLLYAEGTDDLVFADDTFTINTDTGQIENETDTAFLRDAGEGISVGSGIGYKVVTQSADAPKLGVFYVKSLTMHQGATIRVQGKNALAILSAGDVTIDGAVLDVGAEGATAGAGGRDGSLAVPSTRTGIDGRDAPAPAGSIRFPGAGGGGNGGLGGKGGTYVNGNILIEGGASGGTGSNEPLTGGGGGGAAAGRRFKAGGDVCCAGGDVDRAGGGGGGAVLIVSAARLTVAKSGDAAGAIVAPGAGGGTNPTPSDVEQWLGGGAGGGAGGTIVLEAPQVTITGIVTANGGGGAGSDSSHTEESLGDDGHRDAITAAAGGSASEGTLTGDPFAAAAGGAGGARGTPAGEPGRQPDAVEFPGFGGGGGGGAGRILIHTRSKPTTKGSIVSPAMAVGEMQLGRVGTVP